jgi:hypothetical protein
MAVWWPTALGGALHDKITIAFISFDATRVLLDLLAWGVKFKNTVRRIYQKDILNAGRFTEGFV